MYRVRVDWRPGQDTNAWWNETCAWVVEEFGLPGSTYKTEITEGYMIFDFERQEDAALMALRWGKPNGQ